MIYYKWLVDTNQPTTYKHTHCKRGCRRASLLKFSCTLKLSHILLDKAKETHYYEHINSCLYVFGKKVGENMSEVTLDCCDGVEIHQDRLKIVTEQMPEEEELYDLAELFKVFGDSTRIRILFVLFEAEVCVCDLAEALHMTQPAISHQLKILKQAKLVRSRREGKSVFYSLADGHVRTIIAQGREHIEE